MNPYLHHCHHCSGIAVLSAEHQAMKEDRRGDRAEDLIRLKTGLVNVQGGGGWTNILLTLNFTCKIEPLHQSF